MKFKDLKKSVTNGAVPIYLIQGEDAFLRNSAVDILKDAFLTFPEFNFDCFDSDYIKESADGFFATVSSYPFMAEKRLVMVSEFYPTAADLKGKMLKRVFTEDFDTTVLIIVNTKKSASLEKQERVTVVDCSKLETQIIVKWIRAEALKDDVVIGTNASEKIIEFCRGDMTRINAETKKLIAYVGRNGEITENDVEILAVKDTDYQVYELADSIAKGKNDKAFTLLKDMLDKNTDKQRLFTSIYYHFRRLFYSAISGCTNAELAASLGVEEYAVKKSREQAKNFTPKRLKFICDKLSLFDGAFKSGEISLDDALFNTVFNIMIEK